ncbi:MAG: hypothetical protein AVDCRST_MAG13-1541, partial [uncultured Solirubrobacteraceae bacterium]
ADGHRVPRRQGHRPLVGLREARGALRSPRRDEHPHLRQPGPADEGGPGHGRRRPGQGDGPAADAGGRRRHAARRRPARDGGAARRAL